MLDRGWLGCLAIGGCLAVLLGPTVLRAQVPSADQPGGVSEEQSEPRPEGKPSLDQVSEPIAPVPPDIAPVTDTPVSPAVTDIEPAIDAPVGALSAEMKSGGGDRYPNCEFESVAECNLAAQQDLAASTFWMMVAAIVGVIITVPGLYLLWRTLHYTRRAANAAQDAAAEARRQADAMISLEAAKFAVSRITLAPARGGVVQSNGIPINGHTPHVEIKNIGKTRAFISTTSIIMKVSVTVPERRYPMASQIKWFATAGVQPGRIISIKNKSQLVTLSDDQRELIDKNRLHLWIIGCVWYRDWFDNPRTFEFLWRWKCLPLPNETVDAPTGFVPHEPAQ